MFFMDILIEHCKKTYQGITKTKTMATVILFTKDGCSPCDHYMQHQWEEFVSLWGDEHRFLIDKEGKGDEQQLNKLKEQFGVDCYPTTIVIPDEKFGKIEGAPTTDAMREMLTKFK